MTIAYLTHDEVNASTARKLAGQLGLDLVVLDVRQTDPTAVRLICDLDHLPPDVKAGLLANARDSINLSTLAMHSYNLTAAEVRTLRTAGAEVARRLSAKLFGASAPARSTVAA
jgi:pyruvate-formate lyase-activating enzyme